MKANEAPKKIYLHIRPNKEIGSTWHGNKISDTDIEYARTDAFIDKAAEWLRCNLCNFFDSTREESDKFIYNFKNAMKL